MADLLDDLTESYEYDRNRWDPIRREAKTDMQYVSGDPWTKADKDQRKNRPTVAPEEMGQYFNQVINALRSNPRGMKFAATGNGASEKGAQFYQNKAREIEYRSHAKIAYIGAAENAIQRSYGFVSVGVRYASPRSANQELWIEGYPNPDMVLPDTDAIRPDSSDMKRCFEFQWVSQKDFIREYGKKAKITSFGEFRGSHPSWIVGDRILKAKYWSIQTKPRTLLLVQPPSTVSPRALVPNVMRPPEPLQVFKDELGTLAPGHTVLRELREVDYPEVRWAISNGLEILDQGTWLGKYIPIVSCYGKVIYIEGDTGMERKILSMTRFGRDPWKSYCYACSQQLEVLARVPKISAKVAAGQLKGFEKDWQEAQHIPKAFLQYHAITEATGQQILSPPEDPTYSGAAELQALELVKEGFRRAIQAAMGSNFLPTQAQRRNEKSGIALDKIEQAATQGTFHFVNSYEDMIRQVGVITEDLIDKIHDYTGDVDVIEADGKSQRVRINDPHNPEAVSTKGDYLCTVSTAPSSDSEREAAEDFTDTLVGNIQMIAGISGQKAAAAVLARSIKMRNLGPQGDQLADLIEPPEYKTKDGQPPPAELLAAQQEIQQLKGVLQQAATEKQAKVVESQGKFAIAKMQEEHEDQRAGLERETKITVAELGAKVTRMELFMEERDRIGAQLQATMERIHQALEATKDRVHDVNMARVGHQHALDEGQQAVDGQLVVQAHQPQPEPTVVAGA